jgi:hypothetical protein
MAEPRYFTVDEANAMLPRLRVLLTDIREKKLELDRARAAIAGVQRTVSGNGHAISQSAVSSDQGRLEEAASSLRDLIETVNALGVLVKDLDVGLLDFPALRDGEEVELCWKLGESAVEHWHRPTEGFAGRKPL